jgi:DNA modification methylase
MSQSLSSSSFQPSLRLFPSSAEMILERGIGLSRADLGTFKASLRAPIHRWFTYPAGFSYRGVEEAFKLYNIRPGMTVYEPFAGTATTNLVAKQQGVHSFGIEAHPFVQFVAQTKLFWEFDIHELQRNIDLLISAIRASDSGKLDESEVGAAFPELVRKCYSPTKLARLWLCREAIFQHSDLPFRNLAKLALTNLLRSIADVHTGWPYIAPGKPKSSTLDVFGTLQNQLYSMAGDIAYMIERTQPGARTHLIAGDSRERHDIIENNSIDLSFTSPPYLNNYDYADRTRLETYFWGEAKSWSDITKNVRNRLIMSATTQALRGDFDKDVAMSADLRNIAPKIAENLQDKVSQLVKLRMVKGGKKSYDMMVSGYFNDMLPIVQETYRVMKPGSSFVLILGDSAPYGVHIPTDVYLGEIGVAVGFERYEIEDLRTRGGKWKNNPQRHTVELKESILTLFKR